MFKASKNTIILMLFLIILLSAPCLPSSPEPIKALWIETTSNLYLLKDRESIANLLDKIKDAGFNAVIPEAKNSYGYALYQSKIAPKINDYKCERPIEYSSPEPNSGQLAKFAIEPNFDVLKTIIEEARLRDMKVITAVNIFSEGLNAQEIGPAFTHPEWQSTFYINGKFIPASKRGLLVTFVNPIHPEVIEYELSILEELMKNYEIDGLILDRARYTKDTDFSDLSREKFEQAIGQKIKNWPDDIFNKKNLYNRWISFRAQNIKDFMIKARQKQKEIKPDVLFMDYVAGWYQTYYNEGVNWAAEGYEPLYYWTDKYWPEAGIAGLFDNLMVGVYYHNTASIKNNIYFAQDITQSKTKIIPAIFLKIHTPAEIKGIVAAIKESTPNGAIMVFDLSYLKKDDAFWQEIKKALQ